MSIVVVVVLVGIAYWATGQSPPRYPWWEKLNGKEQQ